MRLALLFTVPLLFAGCSHNTTGSSNELAQMLQDNSMQLAHPPQDGLRPGTIVIVSKKNTPNDFYFSGYVCHPDWTHYPDTTNSKTITLESANTPNVDLSASILKSLNISAKYTQSVTVKIENAEISSYAPDDLNKISASLGPDCQKYYKKYQNSAAFILRALKLDYTYKFTLNPDIEVGTTQAISKNLQNASITLKDDGTFSVSGQGLYYGVALFPVKQLE